MNDNINLKILESYTEIAKLDNTINNKMSNFITKANELVELSEDDYQIERTLRLNKISLKNFLLESSCCVKLNENKITDYSLAELKDYLTQYETIFNEDYSKYFLAVSLYELIEDIEELVDSKINLEINKLNNVILNLNTIENITKVEYESLYSNLKNQLDAHFKNNRMEEKTYTIYIQMLNDVFNFYINGYPNIPDEYLYKNDD